MINLQGCLKRNSLKAIRKPEQSGGMRFKDMPTKGYPWMFLFGNK